MCAHMLIVCLYEDTSKNLHIHPYMYVSVHAYLCMCTDVCLYACMYVDMYMYVAQG